MDDDVKPDNAQCIDEHISATWPDKNKEPELYAIVEKFMTHKNCKKPTTTVLPGGEETMQEEVPQTTSAFDYFRRQGISFVPALRERR